MTSRGVQTITCEGCGSRWTVISVGNEVVARLVECPLCAEKEVAVE